MPNPRLNDEQLEDAKKLLDKIRKEIAKLANNDFEMIFAYRRKIYKELTYDERGKPRERNRLKVLLWEKQQGRCRMCKKRMIRGRSVLDRKKAIDGYTEKNVRLICMECDRKTQEKRGYR